MGSNAHAGARGDSARMENNITPEMAMAAFGALGLLSMVLACIVSIKKLLSKQRHHEALPRGEYEKDEKGRAEQIETLEARCTLIEAAVEKNSEAHLARTDRLIESLGQLRVEVATLTAYMRLAHPGEPEWNSALPDRRTSRPPPLPPKSSLLPRQGQGSSPASST